MLVESWANAARRDKWNQTSEHQRTIDTFQGLLKGNISPNTAAGAISSLYEPLIKNKPVPPPVAMLWGIFFDAVRALGGSKELSERLIDLLDSISHLPDVTDEHGNAITPYWSDAVHWMDLPEFAIMFREYGIGKLSICGVMAKSKCLNTGRQLILLADIEGIEEEDEMEGSWDDQAVLLLNATTFGAMCLARGNQVIGMLFHAKVSLGEVIEVACQTPDQQRLAAMYVPPATTWILLAGERLYEVCKSDLNREDGAIGYVPLDVWLWGKGQGYSLEWWAFWKKGFGEIATTQGLLDGVKDLAARAVSEMDKIES